MGWISCLPAFPAFPAPSVLTSSNAHSVHRRQLEDVQDRAGSGRVRQRAEERREGHHRRRNRRGAAVHRGPRGRRGCAQFEHRRGGAGHLLGARGRVHRRGVAGDGEGSGRGVRHYRPLRTAAAVRGDRRHRQSQDRGGHRRRADADRLHRRDAGGTGTRRDVRRARSADQGRPRSPDGRADRRAHRGLRTGLGDWHRTYGDGGPGWRCARAHSQADPSVVRRRCRRSVPPDLRRQRETGQYQRADCRA